MKKIGACSMLKPWVMWAFVITILCGMWAAVGYMVCDYQWSLKEAKQQKAAADAAAKLSEEYRKKEQANATEWAAKETQYINQAGADERDYRDTIARIRAGNGVRVKRELTCSVSGSASTSSSGNDKAQGGLSSQAAEDVIRIGREADEVARQLALCQDYARMCYETHKTKAP